MKLTFTKILTAYLKYPDSEDQYIIYHVKCNCGYDSKTKWTWCSGAGGKVYLLRACTSQDPLREPVSNQNCKC